MAKKIVRRTRRQVYDLWVKALRSGKYRQAKDALRDGGGFCCLGVLCDLARKDGGEQWSKRGLFLSHWSYSGEDGALPRNIARFMGVNKRMGGRLADMNDNGKSFKEIADYIETNLAKD